MWPSKDRLGNYLPIDGKEEQTGDESQKPKSSSLRGRICTAVTIVAFLAVFGAWALIGTHSVVHYPASDSHIPQTTASTCVQPPVRHEWRSLSRNEKQSYIKAAKCLSATPSRLGLNATLHDDFPYSHVHVGADFHESASFLPWHRYYIQVYEDALRADCGYTGYLPYWDWSLDWEDIASSPIWDSETGFGGDGSKTGEVLFDRGRCIEEGPFAGLQVRYHGKDEYSHCLSRGFLKEEDMRQSCGSQLRPTAVDQLLSETDYEAFLLKLENGPHAALLKGVGGDFFIESAPNDPIFFLHHAQLDRLWWLWQQKGSQRKMFAYNGKATVTSAQDASLEDELYMHGLAPEVVVSDMMNTESGPLCYRY